MGTTAQKLQRVLDTKEGLKDTINTYLGQDITSAIPFKDYETYIKNFYNSLPKTDYEEGTEITLSNTLKGKLDFENDIVGYGDTQQESTTGTQRADTNETIAETTANGITYSLKNGIFKLNGTCTKAFNIVLTNVVSLESGAYSFGISDVSGAYGGVIGKYMDNSSGAIMLEGGQLRNTTKSSLSESYDNLHARLYIAKDVAANNLSFKLNLVKGTYTSDTIPAWEPYTNGASPNPTYPQDIEVVTGTQEVKVENVNLLKLQTLTEQTINGITFTPHYENDLLQYINVNGTATSTATYNLQGGNPDYASTYPCSVKAGTYYLSGYTGSTNAYKAIYLRYTYDNSTYTGLNDITSPNFTLTQNAKITSYIRIQSGQTCNNEKVYPQIEKGSTATPYTPHQEQTQIVSLGNIELCKIGNYQDYLYKSNDKWYKKEQIGKYTFTGNETFNNWNNNRVTTNVITNYEAVALSTTPNLLCNNYITVNRNNSQTNNAITFFGSSEAVRGLIICDSIHNTNTLMTTWLTQQYQANTPVCIYYALATSNDIEITNTTLIEQLDNIEKAQSYNGTTNISSSGNLPMIIKARALKGE